MTKLIKYKYILGLIGLILICSFFFIKLFSNVNIYQPFNISVKGLNETEVNKITFYCNTPFNRKYKVLYNNNWYSLNPAFYKNILYSADDSIIKNISQLEIIIGKEKYLFNNSDIIKFSKYSDDKSLYVIPNYVTGDKSLINKIISIIYWGNFLRNILLIIAFLFALYLIIYKTKYFLFVFKYTLILIKDIILYSIKEIRKIPVMISKFFHYLMIKSIRIFVFIILEKTNLLIKYISILAILIVIIICRIYLRDYVFNILIIEIIDFIIFLIIFYSLYFIYKKITIYQRNKSTAELNIKLSAEKIITETILNVFLFLLLAELCLRIVGIGYRYYESENTNPTKQNIIKILCIGDSFTFGDGATPGNEYPNQLERLLNTKTNNKFKVYNRGVGGQNSTSALNNLQMQINSTKPNLVIVLIGGRNLINQYGHGSFLNQTLYQFRVYKMYQMIYNSITKENINLENEKKVWELNVFKSKNEGGDKKYFFTENRDSKEYKAAYKNNLMILNKPNKQETDYFNIGTFYLRERKFYNAIKWFTDGIKLYPKYLKNYEGLAYTYISWNKKYINTKNYELNGIVLNYDDAKNWVLKGIKVNNDNSYLYSVLGLINIYQNNYSEAISWINKGLEIDKKNIECLYYLNDIRKNQTALVSKDIYNKVDSLTKKYRYNYYYFDSLNNKARYYIFTNTYNYTIKYVNKTNYSELKGWVYSDLRKIVELCNSNSVKVMIQNYPININAEYFSIQVNEILKNISVEYSLPFVNNAKVFKSFGNDMQYYFSPDGHPNDKGYGLIAKDIFDKIVKERLFNTDTIKIQFKK